MTKQISNVDRRKFNLGLTTALLGLGANSGLRAQRQPTAPSGTTATPVRSPYFFKNPTFEVIFLTSLGRAYHSGGNVGKVLYLTRQVEDGNFESAFLAFKQAGDEARAQAEESASHGHKESARQAYLWAQNFYDSATYFVDESKDPVAIPADLGASLRLLDEVAPALRSADRGGEHPVRKHRTAWFFHARKRCIGQASLADLREWQRWLASGYVAMGRRGSARARL